MRTNFRYTLLLISALLIFNSARSQEIATGGWKTYLAYNSVSSIAVADELVYGLTAGSLFSVNKSDGEILTYSKVNGLNDAIISRIAYNAYDGKLLIVYGNGNMDVMGTTGIVNIPDLMRKQMSSSKTVNHISFYKSTAYLACDFGIIAVNLAKNEITDTYFIGNNASELKVLCTAVNGSKIYGVTADAIYQADVSSSHLVNYEYWSTLNNLPGSGKFNGLFTFQNALMLVRDHRLYRMLDTDIWETVLPGFNFTGWDVSGNKLVLTDGTNRFYCLDQNLNPSIYNYDQTIPDARYDGSNQKFWLAGLDNGVVSYIAGTNGPELNNFIPSGPAVNYPWDMTVAGNRLFVVPGGRWSEQDRRPGKVMICENDKWINIKGSDIAAITHSDVLDFMNVAVDPTDSSHFYVTAYGNGLFEFKNDAFFAWHNNTNSSLQTIVEGNPFNYIRLDGAIFDAKKNLWVTNSNLNAAVKIRSYDGKWSSLSFPDGDKPTLGKILISNTNPNQKWINSVRYTPGILIFDDKGTLSDQSDDKEIFYSRFIDADILGSFISPASFYCMEQDLNGTIWVGTDMGPLVFYNPYRAFESGYTCSRVKIPRNDGTILGDYLLQNEKIKSIAVDGGNRKWLGTESSGVYLMSENGQETIFHFTNDNSPLLSNDILSIAINPKSGEVFFGTSKGISSFKSDAASASETFGNVYAYPNPVRENYQGLITITGLVNNTEVKITDISGNLIFKTFSNGSIATWNGKDLSGKKVGTGVYLIICVNEDGTQGTGSKIMIIN